MRCGASLGDTSSLAGWGEAREALLDVMRHCSSLWRHSTVRHCVMPQNGNAAGEDVIMRPVSCWWG